MYISSTETFAPRGVMVIRDTADARETVDSQIPLFLLLEKVLNFQLHLLSEICSWL